MNFGAFSSSTSTATGSSSTSGFITGNTGFPTGNTGGFGSVPSTPTNPFGTTTLPPTMNPFGSMFITYNQWGQPMIVIINYPPTGTTSGTGCSTGCCCCGSAGSNPFQQNPTNCGVGGTGTVPTPVDCNDPGGIEYVDLECLSPIDVTEIQLTVMEHVEQGEAFTLPEEYQIAITPFATNEIQENASGNLERPLAVVVAESSCTASNDYSKPTNVC